MSDARADKSQLPEKLTITLSKPIEFDEKTFDKIELVEPVAGQIVKAGREKDAVASNIVLVSEVAGVPIDVVRKMRARDFERAAQFLHSFL